MFPLFHSIGYSVDRRFVIDKFRVLFCFTVSLITSAVLNFSKRYIRSEKFLNRFLLILLLFVISIFFLIFCNNFLIIILGWDGLGVISYLLVVYFFSKKSRNAGILTILTNRVGDILFILLIRL